MQDCRNITNITLVAILVFKIAVVTLTSKALCAPTFLPPLCITDTIIVLIVDLTFQCFFSSSQTLSGLPFASITSTRLKKAPAQLLKALTPGEINVKLWLDVMLLTF